MKKFDKNNDESSSIQKHSTNNSNNSTTTSGGFSLKNPVSSFRSWVSNKKSSKEDSTINHSITSYGKIDTSPTPRKSSLGSTTTKRIRTPRGERKALTMYKDKERNKSLAIGFHSMGASCKVSKDTSIQKEKCD